MTPETWWKNFAMGLELDNSGTFIYNAIHRLDEIEQLNNTADIFEILYGLSVGIERLQKICIILLEHGDGIDIASLEESLISHNTIELSNRIEKQSPQRLNGIHKEFLNILSVFYKKHRYGRYSLSSVPDIDEEKRIFLDYLHKYLNIDILQSEFASIPNTNKIKTFIGRIVKKIINEVYNIIMKKCDQLNIYTYEIRSDSKAMKVFWGKRLDFINEGIARREIIVFLLSDKSNGKHKKLINEIESLNIDKALIPSCIKMLISDTPEHLGYIMGEIEECYSNEIQKVGERFDILQIIDCDHVHFDKNDPCDEAVDSENT
jgi:hypothetical protein